MELALALIVIAVCGLVVAFAKAAGRADEESERDATAQRLVLQMERAYWRRRYPTRYWPGA